MAVRDNLRRRELLYGILLGIAISFAISISLIQGPPALIEINRPPLHPLHFPA